MYQYYIMEVKKFHNGEFEHNVFWEYDADDEKARLKGESKYHNILAAAAVSDTAEHSAILISSKGYPLMYQCYTHKQEESQEVTENE